MTGTKGPADVEQNPGSFSGSKKKGKVAKFREADPVTAEEVVESVIGSGTNGSGDKYQVNSRNPGFANADKTSPWEMRLLSAHYHPSVCSFSQTVTLRKFIDYDGDPLSDFSIKHFLDRFVRKKPKSVELDKEVDDNASIDSDEFEEILLKNEKNLQGDGGDVEFDDLTDEELDDLELDDEDFFEDDEDGGDAPDLFDSDDELSAGDFSDELDDEDSMFVPAEDVEEDGHGNLVVKKTNSNSRSKVDPSFGSQKRKFVKRKVLSRKRCKRY